MRGGWRKEPTEPTVDTISERAARWAVRVDAGSPGPDEQRELDTWLAADARHLGAYVRACALWVDLDRLAALHAHATDVECTTAALPRRRLIAAAIVAVVVIGGALNWHILRDGSVRYSSGTGEMRRIALSDGSRLLLNSQTEVIVRLTQQRRDVQLVRGEALFEVAHDSARPFIVQAKDAQVRAVGTAFAVRVEDVRVKVTVTEGVVEVIDLKATSRQDRGGSRASGVGVMRVAANERAIIAPMRAPEVETLAPAEADRELSWREDLVSFDGETLEAAVSEINRHNRRQIVIDDSRLASMSVVGVFRASDFEGFAATAAAALNARAVRDGDIIRLQSRSGDHRDTGGTSVFVPHQ
jgi:transmembrane sensor